MGAERGERSDHQKNTWQRKVGANAERSIDRIVCTPCVVSATR